MISLESLIIVTLPGMFLLYLHFLKFIINIVIQQCCVSFRCTTKSLLYIKNIYKCVYPSFLHCLPLQVIERFEYSSLCYTVGPFMFILLYIQQCIVYFMHFRYSRVHVFKFKLQNALSGRLGAVLPVLVNRCTHADSSRSMPKACAE